MAERTDDRFLPGHLNPEVEKPQPENFQIGPDVDGNNFFEKFHEGIMKIGSRNAFAGTTSYKAIVISEPVETKVGGFFGFGGEKRVRFKFRIPELHSQIEDPCAIPPSVTGEELEDKMRKLRGLHPEAVGTLTQEEGPDLPEPKIGDIVFIQYEKGPAGGRLGSAYYVGRYSKGAGTNNISEACNSLQEIPDNGNGSSMGQANHANVGGYGGDPSSWPVSTTAEHLEGTAASTLHDTAKAYYESLDFTWYEDPMMLNLMGLRNTNTRSSNSFDDKIICMYTDDGGAKHVHVWPGTTRPGRTAMMDGRASIAIMVPSAPQYHATPAPTSGGRAASSGMKTYYKGAPKEGKVRGRNSDGNKGYSGLGPDPVQAYRDSNNDDVFNYDPSSIGGCTQCQIHGTKPGNDGNYVGNSVSGLKADGSTWAWSEGCQVWQSWADYTFWLSLWGKQIQAGREFVDYVLIRAEDSPELWGTNSASSSDSESPQAGDPVE